MTFTPTAFRAALGVASLLATTGIASAQGFTGAELSGSILGYSSDSSIGATSYSGGLEFGIVAGISVGADFHYNGFRGRDGNSSGLTLHGMYALTDSADVGLFLGQDRRDSGETDVYGIEGAADISGVSVAGYLGRFDGPQGDGTLVGIDGAFAFTDAISATASAGVVNLDGESLNRISLGGEYQFGGGPAVFAEIGRLNTGSSDESFVSVGGRIELGQGTTFGPRGITGILPTY